MKVEVTYDRYLSLYFEIQEALQSKVYTRVSKFRNIFASRFNEFKFQPRLKGGGGRGGAVFAGGREMKLFSTVFQDFGKNIDGKRYSHH